MKAIFYILGLLFCLYLVFRPYLTKTSEGSIILWYYPLNSTTDRKYIILYKGENYG